MNRNIILEMELSSEAEELELQERLRVIARKRVVAACMYTGTCGYKKTGAKEMSEALDMDVDWIVRAVHREFFMFVQVDKDAMNLFEKHLQKKLKEGL